MFIVHTCIYIYIGQDVSLNIILDEDNQFDTMYHTKNVSNYFV